MHWWVVLGALTLSQVSFSLKEGKDLSFFNVVKFPNDPCKGDSGRNGTCYTSSECSDRKGVSSGTCADGYGVCCIITLACGGQTSENCTYLVQSPTTSPPNTCTYELCAVSPSICRMRLDFTIFSIAGPYVMTESAIGNALGDCVTDTFSVTSNGFSGSPIICGINSGQHIYVDVNSRVCNKASFFYNRASDFRRSYDIKVTQYTCQEEQGGPPGCLQYFSSVSGTVASFNYPIGATATSLAQTGPSAAVHLSEQQYEICFRRNSGYCSICFVPSIVSTTVGSFGLSNNNPTNKVTLNTNCNMDYLIIPNAQATAALANAMNPFPLGFERICGRLFSADPAGTFATTLGASAAGYASVCTGSRPFRISVRFDQNEVTKSPGAVTDIDSEVGTANTNPLGIIGFSLNYVMQKC